MKTMIVPISALFSILSLAACDEDKTENHYQLKEVIDVQGTCSEDHVGQRDNYAGQIVRWQTVETGKISTYGFLFKSAIWLNIFLTR